MSGLLQEIENCRERWAKAKKKGDMVGVALWERVGKGLREKVKERTAGKDLFKTARGIFGINEKKKARTK